MCKIMETGNNTALGECAEAQVSRSKKIHVWVCLSVSLQ